MAAEVLNIYKRCNKQVTSKQLSSSNKLREREREREVPNMFMSPVLEIVPDTGRVGRWLTQVNETVLMVHRCAEHALRPWPWPLMDNALVPVLP